MLFELAVAPVLLFLIYIFIRDKYEKEPIRILTLGVLFGVLITFPIIKLEDYLAFFMPTGNAVTEAFYTAFIIAAFSEELLKYLVLFFLVWKNPQFNERFDGIVYAAFISLGFACLENIMYVYSPDLGGYKTALARALISVPGHGFFGVAMGYYFALAKYEKEKINLLKAFIIPYLLHGCYNFILLSGNSYLMIIFVPFLIYLWFSGLKKMKIHIEASPFK